MYNKGDGEWEGTAEGWVVRTGITRNAHFESTHTWGFRLSE